MCVVDCDETTKEKYAGSRDEQGSKSKEKEDIKPMVMRNIRQTFLCHPFLAQRQKKGRPRPAPYSPRLPARTRKRMAHSYSSILAKISESLKRKYSYKKKNEKKNPQSTFHPTQQDGPREKEGRTSSPSLIALPPQPGNNTLSPVLTDVGTTCPSLFGAPGPTAITVASGSGLDVADVGRKIPVAVFLKAHHIRSNIHLE